MAWDLPDTDHVYVLVNTAGEPFTFACILASEAQPLPPCKARSTTYIQTDCAHSWGLLHPIWTTPRAFLAQGFLRDLSTRRMKHTKTSMYGLRREHMTHAGSSFLSTAFTIASFRGAVMAFYHFKAATLFWSISKFTTQEPKNFSALSAGQISRGKTKPPGTARLRQEVKFINVHTVCTFYYCSLKLACSL